MRGKLFKRVTIRQLYNEIPHYLNLMENCQYRGSVFKIPTMTNWIILVSDPDKVEEIRRAPDDVLEMRDALREVLILLFFPNSY